MRPGRCRRGDRRPIQVDDLPSFHRQSLRAALPQVFAGLLNGEGLTLYVMGIRWRYGLDLRLSTAQFDQEQCFLAGLGRRLEGEEAAGVDAC